MRPNARTIFKVLMRSRGPSFWGSRAYVTVRLPLDLIPPAPLWEPPPEWGEQLYEGSWQRENPDGTIDLRFISFMSGMATPPEAERPLFVRPDDYGYVDWVEANEHIGVKLGADGRFDISETDVKPIPVELVNGFVARRDWAKKHLDWYDPSGLHPALVALVKARAAAKTHYTSVSDRYVYFTFSVKWFYRRRALRFSSDLARAFREIHALGIDAKLMRNS